MIRLAHSRRVTKQSDRPTPGRGPAPREPRSRPDDYNYNKQKPFH